MLKNFSFFILLFVFFFSFLFLSANNSFAWTEYDCEGGCGGNLLCRNCQQVCDQYNASGTECIVEHTECTSWAVCQDCQSWQKCISSNCVCASECLGTPSGPYPSNNDENVKLPVTLMWEAVNGAQSYRYEIIGITQGATTSPYITIRNCTLKSNTSYSWRVQACCNVNGTGCGPWSNAWNFKTSISPELSYPANNDASTTLPVNFDWCNVEEAQSYCFRLYYKGTGREVFPPWLLSKEDDTLPSELLLDLDWLTRNTTYDWETAACLNENGTKCGLNCNNSQNCSECAELSQRWNFTTISALDIPKPVSPTSTEGLAVVNLSSQLQWGGVRGALSYRYRIRTAGEEIVNSTSSIYVVPFSSFWDSLNFNSVYQWQVKSCWDEAGEDCENAWSEEWSFKTTGASPTIVSPGEGATTEIPVSFDWENVAGAASYKFEVSSNGSFSPIIAEKTIKSYENSATVVSYPELRMENSYWWRVSSCADEKGEKCGTPSSRSFTTGRISSPVLVSPGPNATVPLPVILKWEKVDNVYYQYWLVSEGQTIKKDMAPCCTAYFLDLEIEKQYSWRVRACYSQTANDEDCGNWSGEQSFTVSEAVAGTEKGLVPCGRKTDNLETPYNETEACQFKHFFLLIKNILDLILWRLGLIVIVLLAIAVGVVYYFSMGAPETMIKVKSIVGSAAKGYAVIFLAWLIINVILAILGYQIEFFGRWWQINF
ncbi:MAG: pilin [Candidatus Pacebacteria bacterium]|nr:pilin [Candidatus Paceibacterota bacterium]